jgi:SAM-dependent methyltransferase
MKFKFSCVLDYNPLMGVQSYIWLNSLLNNNISPTNIYIHITDKLPGEYYQYLIKSKVNLVYIEPFDIRNRYCNKLTQLDTFNNIDNYDFVFLMDCDTAIVSLVGLELNSNVYAKIVDYPNPPINILKDVFDKNDLDYTLYESTFSLNGDKQTVSNNCNGGLYIISKHFLKKLTPLWKEKAIWCIDNSDIFTDKFSIHADQVGFALAMSSLNENVNKLGIEWNYPIHVSEENINISPKIIHFHDKIDSQIKLKKTNNPLANNQINIINNWISIAIRKTHINSIFWDYRYKFFPDLGSGIGSRGELLKYKRELLKNCFQNSEDSSILDVGCGDLEVIKDFKFKEYLGLDLSSEVITQGKEKKPNWEFKLIKSSHFNFETRDYVICLDVLIHQNSYESYKSLVHTLVNHTKKRLIIAAFDREPEVVSDITFYYEPISNTLSKLGDFELIYKIGEYRSTDVIVADKYNYKLDKVKAIPFENNTKKPSNFLKKFLKYINLKKIL